MKMNIRTSKGIETKKINRRLAIRYKCLDCSGFSYKEVDGCQITKCSLYPYRHGVGEQDSTERNFAIRNFCRICMNGEKSFVRGCDIHTCSLHPFRLSGLDRTAIISEKNSI